MEKDSILILRFGLDGSFFPYINNENLKSFYKKNKYKDSFLFKLLNKLSLFKLMALLYFDDWKNDLNKYKYVVLFDNGYVPLISKYIKYKNPDIKIIFWFWNKITKLNKYQLDDKNIDYFYTYNDVDIKDFNLKYNTTFYTKGIVLNKKIIKYDVCFLGFEKGRKEQIDEISKVFSNQNISSNIIVARNDNDFIKYDDYLDIVSESKCILDIVNENNYGLTLRPMEALFFNKKLITNYKDIKKYDFYNPDNIFVLGEDKIEDLTNFINSKTKNISSKIINKYDFNEWVKRFL